MIHRVLSGLHFYQAGREAARELPGVRKKIGKGYLVSLLVFALVGIGITAFIALVLFYPMERWVTDFLPDWADWIARVTAFLFAATMGLVGLTLSLRFMVILLGFFFEGAVGVVVAHFRPETTPGKGGPSLLVEIVREIFFFVGLLAIEFIPVVGLFLVVVVSSWLVGKGVHAPHKAVLMDRGQDRTPPSNLDCISSGFSEFLFLLVPVIGWLCLPWVMINMVVGQAWLYEKERVEQMSGVSPAP